MDASEKPGYCGQSGRTEFVTDPEVSVMSAMTLQVDHVLRVQGRLVAGTRDTGSRRNVDASAMADVVEPRWS